MKQTQRLVKEYVGKLDQHETWKSSKTQNGWMEREKRSEPTSVRFVGERVYRLYIAAQRASGHMISFLVIVHPLALASNLMVSSAVYIDLSSAVLGAYWMIQRICFTESAFPGRIPIRKYNQNTSPRPWAAPKRRFEIRCLFGHRWGRQWRAQRTRTRPQA